MVTAASSIFRDTIRPRGLGIADRSPEPSTVARLVTPIADSSLDGRVGAILDAPLAMGETSFAGFKRKEHELGAVFASLSVHDARNLHARLSACKPGDALAQKFARLTLERRARLLTFLADARRREALGRPSSR